MSDKFTITPLDQLLEIIFRQLEKGSLFGIPTESFFIPHQSDPFRSYRFNQLLETPLGIAAGPQTQLSQNIVVAWLLGARYIELKTIQKLDELNVAKPCIDMQDEGYNCEWSQELKLNESFEQYLDAWIIIHILKHKFKWGVQSEPGVIFNMSVGYDFEGIQNKNVQKFLNSMMDSSAYLKQKKESIKQLYPEVTRINISPCISNNITVSTMHGCPVDEIEKIGRYLIEDRKLHTSIKLNPTLLGEDEISKILDHSGFKTSVPVDAFNHDPRFNEVSSIIRNLQETAKLNHVHFGLKLTNTLESRNNKNIFPSGEEMMYMSGRALHPISIKVAEKLQTEFHGKLDISFCAGVDAFNIADVIKCGLSPVTVCSDLLKPGGYGRLKQYFEQLRFKFKEGYSTSLNKFIQSGQEGESTEKAALFNLKNYARSVLADERYKKTAIHDPSIKTERKLGAFDCIHAPCVDTCPTNQGIPDYLYYASKHEFDKAHEVILKTNPFPRMTGMVCDHLCQSKCTRINYDSAVHIRDVKRFIAENQNKTGSASSIKNDKKVAIIGAGPSGLSCAYFLKKAGFNVSVFEKKSKPGGMVSGAIPSFRLTDDALNSDLKRIETAGVKINYNVNIDSNFFLKLKDENQFIYISTGAQRSAFLNIENSKAEGVLDPLKFLFDVKANIKTRIGNKVVIIGGGNTAMDAARTAYRLVGKTGTVTIIYRRTINQMPADIGEIKAVMQEGIKIIELAAPLKINVTATSVADNSGTIKTFNQSTVQATLVADSTKTNSAINHSDGQSTSVADSTKESSTIDHSDGQATEVADPTKTNSTIEHSNEQATKVASTSEKNKLSDQSEERATEVAPTGILSTEPDQSFNPATEVAGTVLSLSCIKMHLSGMDSKGRPKPVPIPDSEFIFKCDTIIPAIGQESDINFIDTKYLKTSPGKYETQIENVFIGGDALRGASTAINAIGDGRKVAEAIIRKANLSSTNKNTNGRIPITLNKHILNRSKRINQIQTTELPLNERKNFKLVSRSFTKNEASREASRCLLCDEFCSICTTVCPNLAFHTYEITPATYFPQQIKIENGNYTVRSKPPFKIDQNYQVLHIADWCNECGNCTTFCPTAGEPYKNKPHLYLNKQSFDKEKDGYFLNTSSYNIIYYKKGNHQASLARLDDHFLFQTKNAVITLSIDGLQIEEFSTHKKDKFEMDLREAFEMNIIMQGAISFLQ